MKHFVVIHWDLLLDRNMYNYIPIYFSMDKSAAISEGFKRWPCFADKAVDSSGHRGKYAKVTESIRDLTQKQNCLFFNRALRLD